jgi:hypothetical protein
MSRRAGKNGIAWENRFERPTLGRLLAGLSKEHASVVNHARKGLLSVNGSRELLIWYGLPWRWTFAYQAPDSDRPWGFIIPRPALPGLCLPIGDELVGALVEAGLSRFVRSGLANAPRVGRTYWAQWDLASKLQADELLHIARRRHEEQFATVA